MSYSILFSRLSNHISKKKLLNLYKTMDIDVKIRKLAAVNDDIKFNLSALENELKDIERLKYEKPIIEKLLVENKELEKLVEQNVKYLSQLEQQSEQSGTDIQKSENVQKSVPVHNDNEVKEIKKAKKEAKPKKQETNKTEEIELPVDVGRLDLKVGQIVEIKKHPDADSLYVEQIDIGKEKPITVVSGLVKFIPIEQMQNRFVVILGNLKPAKMRGITSEAMVMCASTPDKVEVLTPPPNSKPGDIITVPGYSCNPDTVLNPKKKIFESVAPDLKTNSECVATYKGAKWTVEGKGHVTAQSLTNVNIK